MIATGSFGFLNTTVALTPQRRLKTGTAWLRITAVFVNEVVNLLAATLALWSPPLLPPAVSFSRLPHHQDCSQVPFLLWARWKACPYFKVSVESCYGRSSLSLLPGTGISLLGLYSHIFCVHTVRTVYKQQLGHCLLLYKQRTSLVDLHPRQTSLVDLHPTADITSWSVTPSHSVDSSIKTVLDLSSGGYHQWVRAVRKRRVLHPLWSMKRELLLMDLYLLLQEEYRL